MSILTVNLKHYYQWRGLWLCYLFLGLFVLSGVVDPLEHAEAGEGSYIGLAVLAFAVGFMVSSTRMEVLTKPFSYCLVGQREMVRKVIFYVDGLGGGEKRSFMFKVLARFPVRAVVPDSKAYLYYEPKTRAEDQGQEIIVKSGATGYDFEDLDEMVDVWLREGGFPIEKWDLNMDMKVDMLDFAMMASEWVGD